MPYEGGVHPITFHQLKFNSVRDNPAARPSSPPSVVRQRCELVLPRAAAGAYVVVGAYVQVVVGFWC